MAEDIIASLEHDLTHVDSDDELLAVEKEPSQLRLIQLCRCQPQRSQSQPRLIGRMPVLFRLKQEDLIGDKIPEWGVLPCTAVLAVQNMHVDALERDLLVSNVVAEESCLLSSGRFVAEMVEQCPRGPRRFH